MWTITQDLELKSLNEQNPSKTSPKSKVCPIETSASYPRDHSNDLNMANNESYI